MLNEGGGFVFAVNNGVTLGFDTQKSTKDFFNDAGFKDFPKLLNNRPVANASIHAGIGRRLDEGMLSFYGESVFTFRGDTSNKFPIHFNGLDLPITIIPVTSVGTSFRADNMSLDGRVVFYDENNNNKPYVLLSGSALF